MNHVIVTRMGVAALTALAVALPAGVAAAAAPPAGQQHAKHAVPGDFDGDGKPDLAVGAPLADRVQIHYTHARPGGSHVEWLRPHAHSVTHLIHFGAALAVGDFDKDGFADLAVGAPEYQPTAIPDEQAPAGAVFVFYGRAGGLRTKAQILPGRSEDLLGRVVAAGDVDGDGYADLAVSQDEHKAGIRVYYGSKSGIRTHGTEIGAGFDGRFGLGDVDGDGRADLVGADRSTAVSGGESGTVRVWSGRKAGLATKADSISGRHLGVLAGLGSAVGIGDIDHDGYADVVLGNSGDRHGGTAAGSIVVLYGGRNGLTSAHAVRINEQKVYSHAHGGDSFGASVAVGRVTGDRYADVVVGAPGSVVTGHADAGAVFFLTGAARGLTHQGVRRITLASPHVPGAAHADGGFGAGVNLGQRVARQNADLLGWVPRDGNGYLLRFTGTDAGLSVHGVGRITSPAPNGNFGFAVA
jgi:hypothetical protein